MIKFFFFYYKKNEETKQGCHEKGQAGENAKKRIVFETKK